MVRTLLLSSHPAQKALGSSARWAWAYQVSMRPPAVCGMSASADCAAQSVNRRLRWLVLGGSGAAVVRFVAGAAAAVAEEETRSLLVCSGQVCRIEGVRCKRGGGGAAAEGSLTVAIADHPGEKRCKLAADGAGHLVLRERVEMGLRGWEGANKGCIGLLEAGRLSFCFVGHKGQWYVCFSTFGLASLGVSC